MRRAEADLSLLYAIAAGSPPVELVGLTIRARLQIRREPADLWCITVHLTVSATPQRSAALCLLTAAMLKCTRAGLSGQSPAEAGRLRSPWAHCRSSTATSQPTKRNRAGLHGWMMARCAQCTVSSGGALHVAGSGSVVLQNRTLLSRVWQLCSIRWRPHHDDTARSQGTLRRGRVPAPCPSRSMGVRASRCTECGGAARVRPS